MQHSPRGAAAPLARRRAEARQPARLWASAISGIGCLAILVPGSQAVAVAAEQPFSLEMVASNLQRLPVPDEGYHKFVLLDHSGCNCDEDPNPGPYQEEASANVDDEDFQVAPSMASPGEELDVERSLKPSYSVTLLQRTAADHRHLLQHRRGGSRSACGCATSAGSVSKALSFAKTATAVAAGSAGDGPKGADMTSTGIFLNTCAYNQGDLLFWRLTNTAYLRGGIVLKETIAYTDSCKMCDYNNVACNKQQVELKAGNCLCVWRMNGAEMQTMLLACSACVTDCIGTYKTFDLGKPEPGMQKGVCLRKKPHKTFDDLQPVPPVAP